MYTKDTGVEHSRSKRLKRESAPRILRMLKYTMATSTTRKHSQGAIQKAKTSVLQQYAVDTSLSLEERQEAVALLRR